MIKNYGLIKDMDELSAILNKFLVDGTPIGIDIETGYDGPDKLDAAKHPEEGFIVGISFTNSLDWARYVPLRHDYEDNFDNKAVAELFWPVLKSGLVIAHNASFELKFLTPWLLEYLGPEVVGDGVFEVLSCTMIEAAVLSEWRRNGLKDLVEIIFNHRMKHFVELFPGAAETRNPYLRFNVLSLDPENVDYACEDALWALALHRLNHPRVKGNFIYKLEMQVLPIVVAMETYGVCFDWAFLRDLSCQAKEFMDIQYANIQDTFSRMLGEPVSVNLASPKQVQHLLYDRLGFATTRFTKSTQDSDDPKMSTDTKALETLAREHPAVRQLLEYREVKKLVGSYTDKFERDYGYDPLRYGVVHPSHNQVFVISGRFSVAKPNYQQLIGGNFEYKEGPLKGKKMTRYVSGDAVLEYCFRDCVTVPEGYYAVGFDYGQAELRALAGEANEVALLQAFADGVDPHIVTAALILSKAIEDITKLDRAKGKTSNFAILYGQGVKAMAESLGITFDEAKDLWDKYFEAYPAIRNFVKSKVAFSRKNGYAVTKFGRKMTIWEYQDTRKFMLSKADRMAVNTVIQGSATGDVPKIAMVRAVKAIKAAGYADRVHLVMNVHDALEFYVHKSVPIQVVIDILEPAVVFDVPGWPQIVADWHTWERWGSCVDLIKDDNGKWVEKT